MFASINIPYEMFLTPLMHKCLPVYICFAVNTLSQYLTDPRSVHLIAAKHILRYLKGTIDYGLKYDTNQKINLEGYVDSYWVGSTIDRKSTSR